MKRWEHKSPSKTTRNSIAKDREKAEKQDWIGFLKNGLPKKILGLGGASSEGLPQPVIDAYWPLIHHAGVPLLRQHREKIAALHALLAIYDEHYQALCLEQQVLLFRDVPRQLARLTEQTGELETAHRLNAAIDHLLLDEFQDTDPQQYAILKEFAQRIHCGARDKGLIFCVGDLKQSIYVWRGGTPQIFASFTATSTSFAGIRWTKATAPRRRF